jgi:hypothetical protein
MSTNTDVEVLALWQQQAREEQIVPLDDVRTKAERLDAKNRRMRVWMPLLLILLLITSAMEVWFQVGILERAGDLLMMAALIYAAYRYRTRHLGTAPAALGRTNCVAFYRAELMRQRDLSEDSWGYLLPFVPGMTLAMLDGVLEARPASQKILLVVLGVAVFLVVHVWNMYTARRFQREIDALDAS